jgi:hypothetical protein
MTIRTLNILAALLLGSLSLAPAFAQNAPADIVADTVPGEKVVLEVTADGTTPFTYQWEKQSATSSSSVAEFVAIPGQTSSRLTLDRMAPDLAGVYRARVSNVAGFALSPTATVRIATPPSVKSFTITVSRE